MKTSLLAILFLLPVAITLKAQSPTLTATNSTFTVGEKFFNQNVKAAAVSILNGGANQTWDYSNVTDSGSIGGVGVVTPQSTPFADSFPGSNLVVKTLNDSAYLFYNGQTASLRQLGASLKDSTTLRYNPSKIYLPYPFTYNSFFTDTVAQVSKEFGVVLSGRDSLTGDGYGTLKTPGHTYNDVLRVKYIENISNVKDSAGVTVKINLRGIAYIYFTPDTHAPLFYNGTIAARSTLSVFGIPFLDTTSYIKNVSYLQSVVLPLSFTGFTATLNNKAVALNWQTAQEINTSHFDVQRSLSGNDFARIATVKASGNSVASNYSYTDQDYVKTALPPSVFYRIKETDNDGKVFYSETRVVHGDAVTVGVYPNPAINYLYFTTSNSTVASAILIYNAKGSLVKQVNNHPLSEPLNIAALSKGNYFIQVKIENATTTATIVKQ